MKITVSGGRYTVTIQDIPEPVVIALYKLIGFSSRHSRATAVRDPELAVRWSAGDDVALEGLWDKLEAELSRSGISIGQGADRGVSS